LLAAAGGLADGGLKDVVENVGPLIETYNTN